jgi:hypothetical protein
LVLIQSFGPTGCFSNALASLAKFIWLDNLKTSASEQRQAMRVFFSILGILVALAVLGAVATKHLKALRPTEVPIAPAANAAGMNLPVNASQPIQRQIQVDVNKSLEQGAARIQEAAP